MELRKESFVKGWFSGCVRGGLTERTEVFSYDADLNPASSVHTRVCHLLRSGQWEATELNVEQVRVDTVFNVVDIVV